MNTVNASTGYSGFQLHLGCAPRVIPPIVREPNDASETPVQFLEWINTDVADARDNLLESKVNQAATAN
ncbi:hypothetical protein AN958_12215 [Leucoagaricus sp. SymC.cos]|nr:hypothetical protein AN958_12215 [Leucoagaricus sp. SymC.cos]